MLNILIITISPSNNQLNSQKVYCDMEDLDAIIYKAIPDYRPKDSVTVPLNSGHLETGETIHGLRYTISITNLEPDDIRS